MIKIPLIHAGVGGFALFDENAEALAEVNADLNLIEKVLKFFLFFKCL